MAAKRSEAGWRRRRAWGRWRQMVRRCTDPSHEFWYCYGGRDISVCPEWLASFQTYYDHVGDPPFVGATLDRINNDGNYEPGNVRWATAIQQRRNRRDPNLEKTHCPNDHPYDEENTLVHHGRRHCRACRREAWTKANRKRSEARAAKRAVA